MRKFILLFLVSCSVCFSSCGKDPVANGEVEIRDLVGDEKVTLLFYADVRRDVFENWGQWKHEKFVNAVIENEKTSGATHMIFGGDNVWFGFLNKSWDRFFEVMKPFVDNDYTICPALGNHELILSDVMYDLHRMGGKDFEALKSVRTLEGYQKLMMKQRDWPADRSRDDDYKKFIDALEEESEAEKPTPLYRDLKLIYGMAQDISLKRMSPKTPAAMRGLGDLPWDRFERYLDADGWDVPGEERMRENKTAYYSFILDIGSSGKQVKIIMLDSNTLEDDETQKEWYEKEKNFDKGPVIVCCHHPLFYPEEPFYEDVEPGILQGWDSPPHLVLTGHYHDYERRSPTAADDHSNEEDGVWQVARPVHIISGSGGAPLESDPHCDERISRWRMHPGGRLITYEEYKAAKPKWIASNRLTRYEFVFNYLRVHVGVDKIHIIVYGCDEIEKAADVKFRIIEQMVFDWPPKAN